MNPNLVIIQYLHTKPNGFDFVKNFWQKLAADQKMEIFHFLYQANQYKTFIQTLQYELQSQGNAIPWTHLFAILIKINKKKFDVSSFLGHSQSSEQYGRFRIDHPELKSLWENEVERKRALAIEEREDLLQQLGFAKQQGLKKQRMDLLVELKSRFPNDPQIQKITEQEKEFSAKLALDKISAKERVAVSMTPQTPSIANSTLSIQAKSLSNKYPHLATDIAIVFAQCELFDISLEVLSLIKEKNTNTLWHELKICIDATQYARALSVIETLNKCSSSDSVSSFSLLYYQALCFYGLGKADEAIYLMKQITKIRPHFKSGVLFTSGVGRSVMNKYRVIIATLFTFILCTIYGMFLWNEDKLQNIARYRIEKFSQEKLPVSVLPGSIKLSLFPPSISVVDTSIIPKKEIKPLLKPLTIKKIKIKPSIISALFGRLWLSEISLDGTDVRVHISKLNKENATHSKAIQIDKILKQIPLTHFKLSHVNIRLETSIKNKNYALFAKNFDLNITNEVSHLLTRASSKSIRLVENSNTLIKDLFF